MNTGEGPANGSLGASKAQTILDLIPKDFLDSHPFIQTSLTQFDQTASEYDKLQIIGSLEDFVRLIRYTDDYIYDQDDPALLPEWRWLYNVVSSIQEIKKELFWSLYGDLAE